MSQGALVLVADRARARLFSWERDMPQLREIGDLVNAEVRLPQRALASDRQGRGLNRQRGARTALGRDSLRRESAQRFAHEVGARLFAELRAQRAARLFVLADPEFLGLLRSVLRKRRLAVPVRMLAKNLTRADAQRIRAYLPERLWLRRELGTPV